MRPVPAYDRIATVLAGTPRAVTEPEVLAELWALGEDGSLRDDPRFRRTPAGRWILASQYLANDWLLTALRDQGAAELSLKAELATAARVMRAPVAWCEGDPRLRFDGDRVRLAPSELGDAPLLEQVPPLQQYTTHLPVLTLRAAAASEPAGEWGRAAEPQHVEPLGWLRVEPRGRPLHQRMFVARIQGQSMDDGRRGIVDGAWAVFEFVFADGVQYGSGSDEPIVLVRGAFDDPEHGTYAVKRWRHDDGEFRLVSLNPDKVRFPDIVVPEAEDVRVVANFERALRPSDYARQPRPPRRKGRRPIGEDALASVTSQLQRRMARFFEGAPPAPGEDEEAPGVPAQVVCLSAEEGGVHIEVGPLPGLEPFVKRVRISGADGERVLLASNLRHRSQRVAVAPGGGPWRCFADGFEDDVDLAALTCEALPLDHLLVFHVDAGGVGRRVGTTALAPSQTYRVLVPAALDWASEGVVGVTSLVNGWRLWELPLPALPVGPTGLALASLGLTVGERTPRLDASLVAPVAWRRTPAGAEYPVFGPDSPLLLRVTGCPTETDGEAAVFVAGPAGAERTALPAGDRAILRMNLLQPGRYAATLMHRRTRVPAASLLFEVGEADAPVSAEVSVTVVERLIALAPGEVLTLDLTAVAPDQIALEATAPPSWPALVTWRGREAQLLAECRTGDDRSVDLGPTRERLAGQLSRSRLGDVVVDFGELGAVVVRYERPPDAIQHGLQALVEQRAGFVRNNPGAWLSLLGHWFEPVVTTLGYSIDRVHPLAAAAEDLAAWPLVAEERHGDTIRPYNARILVLTADLESLVPGRLGEIDHLCQQAKVEHAILSDGLRWRAHRAFRPRVRTVHDLTKDGVVTSAELLTDLAEGV